MSSETRPDTIPTGEFSQCIHTLFPGGDVQILDVQIDNGQLTVTVGSTVRFTPEQIEKVENEFDEWFEKKLGLVLGALLPEQDRACASAITVAILSHPSSTRLS